MKKDSETRVSSERSNQAPDIRDLTYVRQEYTGMTRFQTLSAWALGFVVAVPLIMSALFKKPNVKLIDDAVERGGKGILENALNGAFWGYIFTDDNQQKHERNEDAKEINFLNKKLKRWEEVAREKPAAKIQAVDATLDVSRISEKSSEIENTR